MKFAKNEMAISCFMQNIIVISRKQFKTRDLGPEWRSATFMHLSWSLPHIECFFKCLLDNFWDGRKNHGLQSHFVRKNNRYFAIFLKRIQFIVHGYVVKSRFMRKKLAFHKSWVKTGPFTNHTKTLYHSLFMFSSAVKYNIFFTKQQQHKIRCFGKVLLFINCHELPSREGKGAY